MIDWIASSTIGTVLATSLLIATAVFSWYLDDVFATSTVLGLMSWSIFLVESARRKATGRRRVFPRSPPEWALAAILALLFVIANAASFTANAINRPTLCFVIAALSFVVFTLGLWLDERLDRSAATTP